MSKIRFFIQPALLFLTPILLLPVLTSCASSSSGTAPGWVVNPGEAYDPTVYLWAVGTGPDRRTAENNALSLLARGIQQNVATTTEASKTLSGSEEAGYRQDYSLADTLAVTSSIKDIPGVSFPQVWSARNGETYVLALLDREDSGRFYLKRIQDLAAVIESEILFATQNEGSLEALSALQNAAATARENKGYMDILAGIHPHMYRTITLDYVSAEAVEVLATRQQEKIQLTVQVEGDSHGRVATALTEALGEMGVKALRDAAPATRYSLQGSVSMEQLEHDAKYQYVRFTLSLTLTDTSTSKIIASYSKNGREAHLSYGEAVQRAYRTIEQAVREEFTPQLMDAVNSGRTFP